MALSTALSQALKNKIRTSWVTSTRAGIWSDNFAKLQSAYQSPDMYDMKAGKVTKVSTYNPTWSWLGFYF